MRLLHLLQNLPSYANARGAPVCALSSVGYYITRVSGMLFLMTSLLTLKDPRVLVLKTSSGSGACWNFLDDWGAQGKTSSERSNLRGT